MATIQNDRDILLQAAPNRMVLDNILYIEEKPTWVLKYATVLSEQPSIDALATKYSLSSQKTTYDTAITNLTAYLGTLTNPVAWNNGSNITMLSSDSTGGTTFRSKFTDVDNAKYAINQAADAAAAKKYSTAFLYQWLSTTPGNPSGNSTFTWSTGVSSSYTGGNGWSVTIPTNPGTPGLLLWVASKGVSDDSVATTSTVSWTSGFSTYTTAQNGSTGNQSGTPTVYQWAITIPSGPTGTATYTWATGGFGAAPSGWSLSPGTSPSAGFTLWAAKVTVIDTANNTTTNFNWGSASITAVGYAGTNGSAGSPGTNGNSYRLAYTRVTGNSLANSPSTYTTSGSSSFPPTGTWGETVGWASTPYSISAGESLFQIDGVYSPSTGNTVWGSPYLSSLKVGQLSAISADLGSITAGTITGALFRTAASGQRITINESSNNALTAYNSSGTMVLQIGGSTGDLYIPSTLSLQPATYITGNTISIVPLVDCENSGSGEGLRAGSTGGYGVRGLSTNSVGVRGESTNNIGVQGVGGSSPGVSGVSSSSAGVSGTGSSGYGGYFSSSGSNPGLYSENFSTGHGARIRGGAGSLASSAVIALSDGSNRCFYNEIGVFGPFTGAHDGATDISSDAVVGDIMFDSELLSRNGISDCIFITRLTNTDMDPRSIGVINYRARMYTVSIPAALIDKDITISTGITTPKSDWEFIKDNYDYVGLNAIGEGQINVCGINGNISAGAYITSCTIPGKGALQLKDGEPDTTLRNYTVARARESVEFDYPEQVKQVACVYLCG